MSHEVMITRRRSIFDFFANPGRGGPQHPRQPAPASTGLLRPASAWICKKIKNALSSSYQDLMGHLILTTSPWSILTWITLMLVKIEWYWKYHVLYCPKLKNPVKSYKQKWIKDLSRHIIIFIQKTKSKSFIFKQNVIYGADFLFIKYFSSSHYNTFSDVVCKNCKYIQMKKNVKA